ncbi:hypothetical protein JTE90_004450 [Oedothorax gibbosus]|uniref:HTH psq-type domain-containing protein n=1 Tax=Oedothorax gibbosus TaxID=931172 RepID=A0AAV6UNK1_9ARAC|nr:hypothetical protein JTE90_004450 [Oedothorax gibbosus]
MASTTKRKIHQYSEAALEEALHEIRQGLSTIRAASRKIGVPRGTLQDRIHGRVSEVQKIILDDGRKNPFKNGRPGKKWYASFLRRNPGLEHRVSQGVSKGRAIVTEEVIKKWFKELEDFLKEHDNFDILKDPSRVLNGDETSFSMCPKTGKVIAPKGWKNVYQLQQGNDKETITALLVFSASGKTVTPMVVFPYIRPPKTVVDSMPAGWFLGRSDSGWMKSDVF